MKEQMITITNEQYVNDTMRNYGSGICAGLEEAADFFMKKGSILLKECNINKARIYMSESILIKNRRQEVQKEYDIKYNKK